MRRDLIVGAALLLLTAWAYSGVGSHTWVYEDSQYLKASSLLHFQPGRTLTAWTWSANPAVVHVENLALHLLAGLLVWWLAVQLEWPLPWVVAGLFLLHPIQSEAVAYGAGRGDLLSTIGILIACVGATGNLWLVAGGAIVAILSKETGVVVLPLVGLLWAFEAALTRRRILLLGVCCLVALPILPTLLAVNRGSGVSAWSWAVTQSWATGRLVVNSIWPAWLTVDPDEYWPHWLESIWLLDLVTFGLGAWLVRYYWPRVSLAVWWILICIAPRFLVRTPGSVFNEHQFYGSFVGVALLLTLALDRITKEGVKFIHEP